VPFGEVAGKSGARIERVTIGHRRYVIKHLDLSQDWTLRASGCLPGAPLVLCERGIRTFETATRNTLDISAVPVAQRLSHLPVIVDPSHSGGRRDLVLPLSRAAIAVGADGIIVDVHPHPESALCDGPQALVESDLRELAAVAAHLSPLVGRTLTPAPVVPREPAVA